jgi:hypothetical protein
VSVRYSSLLRRMEKLSPKDPVEIVVLDWDEPMPEHTEGDVLVIWRDYGNDE